MVTIEVLLFASAADLAGRRSLAVEVPPTATVSDVSQAVASACPQMSSLLSASRWALDRQFVPLTAIVEPGKELALIPPVSGG